MALPPINRGDFFLKAGTLLPISDSLRIQFYKKLRHFKQGIKQIEASVNPKPEQGAAEVTALGKVVLVSTAV